MAGTRLREPSIQLKRNWSNLHLINSHHVESSHGKLFNKTLTDSVEYARQPANMSDLFEFLWGCGGSLAVVIVELNQAVKHGRKRLPTYCFNWRFYVIRLLLAGVGGMLAIAYHIQDPILALNIGATTPLMIQALTRCKPQI